MKCKCPHCGAVFQIVDCRAEAEDEDDECEFDEMGFTTRQFTGGDED